MIVLCFNIRTTLSYSHSKLKLVLVVSLNTFNPLDINIKII